MHAHTHNIMYYNVDMPEAMQKQMVSIQFSESVGECSLEWSVKLSGLPPEDRERLELVDDTISKYGGVAWQ